MRVHVITSPSNQIIKDLVRLKDRKGERAETEFVVEGRREIERALARGFELNDFFVVNEIAGESTDAIRQKSKAVFELSAEAYAKVALREGRDGVLGVFKCRSANLSTLKSADKRPFFIVAVEDVEKPGNLGAILRSADAAGVDAVVVLDHTVDVWNQNVIRSSLGGVFSVPVVLASGQDFFKWCRDQNVATVAAAISERSKSVFAANMTQPTAIILGSEARGLSEFWINGADQLAIIPMTGVCDSLNVSVAAAVFMFEAVRQRSLTSSTR